MRLEEVAGASPPALGPHGDARFAIADGAGGFYFHTGALDGFFRVPAGGAARDVERGRLPNGGDDLFWNDVVFDDARRAAVFLVGGSRARDLGGPEQRESLHLSLFDGTHVAGEERLPSLPSWGRAEWVRGTVSAAGGATWIAYPGLVMRQANGDGTWMRFTSQKMKDRLDTDRRNRAREIAVQVIAGLLGAAAILLAGGWLASRAGRVPLLRVVLQIGAASVCAAPGGLLTLAMNPLVHAVEWYGLSLVFCLLGLGLQMSFAAGAAAAMGNHRVPNRRPRAVWIGTAGGALVGAIAGLFVDGGIHHVLDSVNRDVEALRWSIAIVLEGFCATFGYLLSRGPRT